MKCSKLLGAYAAPDKICKTCKFRVYSTRYGYCNECYKSIRNNIKIALKCWV